LTKINRAGLRDWIGNVLEASGLVEDLRSQMEQTPVLDIAPTSLPSFDHETDQRPLGSGLGISPDSLRTGEERLEMS